ncbi:MAG: hypothetical protein AUG51_18610 [Acidobacteria bacterium 13_1_20CM_3_53_8]|nr:MAG: hypothetical protein AUG51_18610 [Acidobacteria bacterium 13_1_20CM_3_53_8]
MKTSSHFQKAIFFEQSPGAADYFDGRVSLLFSRDSTRSSVEAYADILTDPKQPSDDDRGGFEASARRAATYDSTDSTAALSEDSTFKPGSLNDVAAWPRRGEREPGLPLLQLSEPDKLRGFILVCSPVPSQQLV